MTTKTRIQKVSSKGQITLPVSWRKNFDTDTITVTEKNGVLEIRPTRIEDHSEVTVFDALRDNNGKGLYPEEIISILEKIKAK